jgi:CRISPR-associated endonuclease Csy4
MQYYQEITLLPNPEVGLNFLWTKVFQQIHLGLVEIQDVQKQVPIGVSFPAYSAEKPASLGDKCRLFADDEAMLERFDAKKWLARLSDYVHCTGIRPVPAKRSGYAVYRRVQPKNNTHRLARRYAKRHEIGLEQALRHYQGRSPASTQSPFIRLRSLSSGEMFCLFISKTSVAEAIDNSGCRCFSTYGLSATRTVPEF